MVELRKIKVSDAAKLLGKSEQFIRIGLQRNILPFGHAVKMSSKWTYHISPKLLDEYVGFTKKIDQMESINYD